MSERSYEHVREDVAADRGTIRTDVQPLTDRVQKAAVDIENRDRSALLQAFDRLDVNIEALGIVVGALEAKVGPIVRPSPADDVALAEGRARVDTSPLCDRVGTAAARVELTVDRITALLASIDL